MFFSKQLLSDQWIIRHQRWFHLLRVVLACAIALTVIHLFSIPHASWSLITIIVVMGPVSYLGSVLTKANQRLIGTLIGAAMGFTLYLLPINQPLLHDALLLGLIAACMVFVAGRHSYAAILAGITLVLVAGTGPGDLQVAEWRLLNVLLGTLITWLCSRLFFPSRALVHLQMLTEEFLQLSSDYYLLHSHELVRCQEKIDYNLKLLSRNLAKQRSLTPHAQKEWKGDGQIITDIVISERRVLSIIENLVTTEWPPQSQEMLNVTGRLFHSISQLSLQVGKGQVQQFLAQDMLEETTPDKLDNLSQCGYLWLNQQLSQHVSALSFCLCRLYKPQE